MIAEGTLTEVSAYPRLVVEAALNQNAHSVVLCHNHPSGAQEPSLDDLQTTLQLQGVLQVLGITLLDHIIVAASRWAFSRRAASAAARPVSGPSDAPVAADSSGHLLPKRRGRRMAEPEED